MTSNRLLKLLAVATFAAASTLSIQGAATAGPAAGPESRAYWVRDYEDYPHDGDDGGVSIMESLRTFGGDNRVYGHFRALGEHVQIADYFDNDRATIVKLWVGGSGPAVFYGDGDDSHRTVEWPSYAEGQTVHIQVCTSDHPNAVCTKKEHIKGKS